MTHRKKIFLKKNPFTRATKKKNPEINSTKVKDVHKENDQILTKETTKDTHFKKWKRILAHG